jgi:hypothetical protein
VADVKVVIDKAAVDVFRGWNGPLGHSVNRLAKETEWRARTLANRRTGRMIEKMETKKGKWSKGIEFQVGTSVPYALFVHEGTKAHEIKPRTPGGLLVFYWPKVGKTVYFRRVWHPETRPYKFLERALEGAMRMWQRGG